MAIGKGWIGKISGSSMLVVILSEIQLTKSEIELEMNWPPLVEIQHRYE